MTRKYYEWSDRYLDSERSNDKVDTSNINADAIKEEQIDEGISPTWTGEHTFGEPTTFEQNISFVGTRRIGWESGVNLNEDFNNNFIIQGADIEDKTVSIRDGVSNTTKFRVRNGGVVSVENTNLQLDTGQAIEDGDGNERFEIDDANTTNIWGGERSNNEGRIRIEAGSEIRNFVPNGGTWSLRDEQGSFRAVEYQTSASSPGALELTNADLDAAGNDVTGVGAMDVDRIDIGLTSHDIVHSREFDDDTEIFEQIQLEVGKVYQFIYAFGTTDSTEFYLTFDNADTGDNYTTFYDDGTILDDRDRIEIIRENSGSGISWTGQYRFYMANNRQVVMTGQTGTSANPGQFDETLSKAKTKNSVSDQTFEFITEADGQRIRNGYLAMIEIADVGDF